MLNGVCERMPPRGTPVFLTLYACVVSVCCVSFASLNVVCDEIYDCARNIGL